MYSRIPMPRMDWTEERMRYALCFFPLIGAVIGAVEIATFALCEILGAGVLFRTCLLTAVPLLITGGIHMDGYQNWCWYFQHEGTLFLPIHYLFWYGCVRRHKG